MALIACRECDAKLSTRAKQCPHCGAPTAKLRSGLFITLVIVAFMAAIAHAPGMLALFAVGGMSTELVAESVKSSMQQKFDSDAGFKQWHLKVKGVHVLEQGDNRYQGMATVVHDGKVHDVPVDITADGSNVMWTTQPGTFMFVLQKEIQKLWPGR